MFRSEIDIVLDVVLLVILTKMIINELLIKYSEIKTSSWQVKVRQDYSMLCLLSASYCHLSSVMCDLVVCSHICGIVGVLILVRF